MKSGGSYIDLFVGLIVPGALAYFAVKHIYSIAPGWVMWMLAGGGLACLVALCRVPGKRCDGCPRWVWFLAPGWHTERSFASGVARTYCRVCWAAAAPDRERKAAAARARAADLREQSKQFPQPTAAEAKEARALVERLRDRGYANDVIDAVERIMRKYGPNLPRDVLAEINRLTSRGFTGRERVGYQQDDESGYKWVWTNETKPCHIDTSRIARLAGEFLEMDAARRG